MHNNCVGPTNLIKIVNNKTIIETLKRSRDKLYKPFQLLFE